VIELMMELIKKKSSGRLSMVAFSPPWVSKKTPSNNALKKSIRSLFTEV
jgi:hypothetical protein